MKQKSFNIKYIACKTKQVIAACGILFIISSCNSYKKLTYLQHVPETKNDSLFVNNKPTYKIQPGDLLYVRIITGNTDIDPIFNPLFSNQISANLVGDNLFFMTYSVSDSGYIRMPIMDTIMVEGLNIEEARQIITKKTEQFLKEAQVTVKFAQFNFTLLGEVKSPGPKEVMKNNLTVFEAVAHGGDITYNGNRENVLLIRPGKKGFQTFRIDLTDKNLISSNLFYILPNDIIYVEPLKTTLFRERTSDYMFYLSTFTSIVTAVALILNLTK